MKKFNSQICTTKEQSQRLLDLGLKPETADCQYAALVVDWEGRSILNPKWRFYGHNEGFIVQNFEHMERIPAWSLHRLIDLCGAERMPISFYKKGKVMIRVNHIHPTQNGRSNYNHYDSLIDCIEWLVSEGYFNKEYLKQ